MITRTELKRISKNSGLNLYHQEKEYLQYIFLREISKDNNFCFKGGTALRLCYSYTRFSTDIDFDTVYKPTKIKEKVHNILKRFKSIGLKFSFVKEELFENNYTSETKVQGPLYMGKPESTNSLRIDIGTRKLKENKFVQIKQKYPDVDSFLINVMTLPEIFIEKLNTIIERKKGRDLFDIWVILNDKSIDRKTLLKNYKPIKKISFCTKKEYEIQVGPLIQTLPDYGRITKEIKDIFVKK